jgi:hypothetical protein
VRSAALAATKTTFADLLAEDGVDDRRDGHRRDPRRVGAGGHATSWDTSSSAVNAACGRRAGRLSYPPDKGLVGSIHHSPGPRLAHHLVVLVSDPSRSRRCFCG